MMTAMAILFIAIIVIGQAVIFGLLGGILTMAIIRRERRRGQ